MTRPPYEAKVKARAMAWVVRKTTPTLVIVGELGVPRQTPHRWREATRPPRPTRLWAMPPAVAWANGGGT